MTHESPLPRFHGPSRTQSQFYFRWLKIFFFTHSTIVTDGSFFFLILAIEDVSNYKLSLGHLHFDYAETLLNHTSSTAKLEKKFRYIRGRIFFILIWLSRRCQIINAYWAIRILIMLNHC